MEFVCDSNVYVFAFGIAKYPACTSLLTILLRHSHTHQIRVCRTIVEEVRDHLTNQEFREFIGFVNALTTIDEDFFVPFELGSKYEWQGLKPADAFIAAYTEWVGADALISENRHFLSRHAHLPFRVMTAHAFLQLIRP